MRALWTIVAGSTLLAACGTGSRPDGGGADAPADSPDDGRCGEDIFFTAELVDGDSSATGFRGVFGARFTAAAAPAATATTAPNGRIELCAPMTDPLVFEVDAPDPYVDGVAIVDGAALVGRHGVISMRTFRGVVDQRQGLEHADPAQRALALRRQRDRADQRRPVLAVHRVLSRRTAANGGAITVLSATAWPACRRRT